MGNLAKILLLGMLGLSTTVEGQRGGGHVRREVRFYEQQTCGGHHYAITINRVDECKIVPSWLHKEGWDSSVDPQGHCIKIYDNYACRESIQPVSYGYSAAAASTREDIIRRCRSTKELGFNRVRAVKRVQC